jgi:hypothetical protein
MFDEEPKTLHIEVNRATFSKASILRLGPTEPLIEREPENISSGIMRSGPQSDSLNALNVLLHPSRVHYMVLILASENFDIVLNELSLNSF